MRCIIKVVCNISIIDCRLYTSFKTNFKLKLAYNINCMLLVPATSRHEPVSCKATKAAPYLRRKSQRKRRIASTAIIDHDDVPLFNLLNLNLAGRIIIKQRAK